MKRFVILSVFLLGIICPPLSYAVDVTRLPGDYTLTAFRLQYYDLPVIVTSTTASSYSGRLSMTEKGVVMDISGTALGESVEYYTCGFYTAGASSNEVNVSIRGGGAGTVQVSYENGTLITGFFDYDDDGYLFWLGCTWVKNKSYTAGSTSDADLTEMYSEGYTDGMKAALTNPVASQPISEAVGATTTTFEFKNILNTTWYFLWIEYSDGTTLKEWYKASNLGDGETLQVTVEGTQGGKWWVRTWNKHGYGPWSSGRSLGQ